MKCKSRAKDGSPCKAHSISNEEFCFFHSKSKQEDHKQATSKGGSRRKSTYKASQVIEISNSADVTILLADTINEVRAGRMEVRIANCIGFLSGHLLKAYESGEMANRLEKLEQHAGIDN